MCLELDLLVIRKHVFNCSRLFKAADHRTTWEHVEHIRERVHEWPSLLLPIHKHIYLERILRMRQRGNWPWIFVILKSKSTVYLLTTFLKRLQILKQEWQEKSSWDQANRRQKLGLVWRIRKKISQIIKDYFYLPFFLLIILWCVPTIYLLEKDILSTFSAFFYFQAELNESNTLLNFILFVCDICNPFLANMERNSSLYIGTEASCRRGGYTSSFLLLYPLYHFIVSHLITMTEIDN